MCMASTPDLEEAPEMARERKPDEGALFEAARVRAGQSGGGRPRQTVLSGLAGVTTEARTANRTALSGA